MNNEKFSISKRAKSFTHAGRGIALFFKTTHNAWVHAIIFLAVVCLGFYFQITQTDWLAIIIVSGFVFGAEAFNTSIEIDMDLTSPEFHPSARDTKDIAAGAVLIASITAILIGSIVFIPYIFAR